MGALIDKPTTALVRKMLRTTKAKLLFSFYYFIYNFNIEIFQLRSLSHQKDK